MTGIGPVELDHIRESQALSYYKRWVSEIFNVIQIDLYVCEQKEFEGAADWSVGHLDDGNIACKLISDRVYVRASLLATGLQYSYEMTLRIGMERCDCRILS